MKSAVFTTVTFCSAFQVSHYLDVLKALSENDQCGWRVFYKHGVWSKGQDHYVPGTQVVLQEVDEILVIGHFVKKNAAGAGLANACFNYQQGEKKINLWEYGTVKSKRMAHDSEGQFTPVNVCQKPIRLLADIICHFTLPNDAVLDLFSGTGSTAIACALYNRNCVSVDNNDFQILQQRKRFTEFMEVVENYHQTDGDGELDTRFFRLDTGDASSVKKEF